VPSFACGNDRADAAISSAALHRLKQQQIRQDRIRSSERANAARDLFPGASTQGTRYHRDATLWPPFSIHTLFDPRCKPQRISFKTAGDWPRSRTPEVIAGASSGIGHAEYLERSLGNRAAHGSPPSPVFITS
jgi:hypothetical protein